MIELDRGPLTSGLARPGLQCARPGLELGLHVVFGDHERKVAVHDRRAELRARPLRSDCRLMRGWLDQLDGYVAFGREFVALIRLGPDRSELDDLGQPELAGWALERGAPLVRWAD